MYLLSFLNAEGTILIDYTVLYLKARINIIKEPSDKNSIWMIICYNLTYSELE
jgi:hypothetical protein